MSAVAFAKHLGRGIFMADIWERTGTDKTDETRDWRKFVIPAMGSIILVLLGVIISLVTLDRSGIKSEICDLRTEFKETAKRRDLMIQELQAKDAQHEADLKELKILIRLSFPERSRLFGNGEKYGNLDDLKKKLR